MIGIFRADLRKFHNLTSGNRQRIFKPVDVPKLEDGHIDTDMRRIEPVILTYPVEKTGQMPDVIHGFGDLVFTFWLLSSFSMSSYL